MVYNFFQAFVLVEPTPLDPTQSFTPAGSRVYAHAVRH